MIEVKSELFASPSSFKLIIFSAGKSNHVAVGRIALTMCLSCASAGTVQALISSTVQWWRGDKHINTNEIANAVLGGLVAVTGCCPFIEPPFAVIIGSRH